MKMTSKPIKTIALLTDPNLYVHSREYHKESIKHNQCWFVWSAKIQIDWWFDTLKEIHKNSEELKHGYYTVENGHWVHYDLDRGTKCIETPIES